MDKNYCDEDSTNEPVKCSADSKQSCAWKATVNPMNVSADPKMEQLGCARAPVLGCVVDDQIKAKNVFLCYCNTTKCNSNAAMTASEASIRKKYEELHSTTTAQLPTTTKSPRQKTTAKSSKETTTENDENEDGSSSMSGTTIAIIVVVVVVVLFAAAVAICIIRRRNKKREDEKKEKNGVVIRKNGVNVEDGVKVKKGVDEKEEKKPDQKKEEDPEPPSSENTESFMTVTITELEQKKPDNRAEEVHGCLGSCDIPVLMNGSAKEVLDMTPKPANPTVDDGEKADEFDADKLIGVEQRLAQRFLTPQTAATALPAPAEIPRLHANFIAGNEAIIIGQIPTKRQLAVFYENIIENKITCIIQISLHDEVLFFIPVSTAEMDFEKLLENELTKRGAKITKKDSDAKTKTKDKPKSRAAAGGSVKKAKSVGKESASGGSSVEATEKNEDAEKKAEPESKTKPPGEQKKVFGKFPKATRAMPADNREFMFMVSCDKKHLIAVQVREEPLQSDVERRVLHIMKYSLEDGSLVKTYSAEHFYITNWPEREMPRDTNIISDVVKVRMEKLGQRKHRILVMDALGGGRAVQLATALALGHGLFHTDIALPKSGAEKVIEKLYVDVAESRHGAFQTPLDIAYPLRLLMEYARSAVSVQQRKRTDKNLAMLNFAINRDAGQGVKAKKDAPDDVDNRAKRSKWPTTVAA